MERKKTLQTIRVNAYNSNSPERKLKFRQLRQQYKDKVDEFKKNLESELVTEYYDWVNETFNKERLEKKKEKLLKELELLNKELSK